MSRRCDVGVCADVVGGADVRIGANVTATIIITTTKKRPQSAKLSGAASKFH